MTCPTCGFESPAGMRFCGGCGRPLPEQPVPVTSAAGGTGRAAGGAAPAAGGAARAVQRRHMTVMFCDLVGSTELVTRVDAEDFRDVLAEFHRACAAAIEPFKGYIAKYTGDGVIVYFGYPLAHEDNAQRAVYAGLGILEELSRRNGQLAQQHGVTLHVRIGVHTGMVLAGEMGAGETREELAIVGETPHIAARLESIAPPDEIVISDVTHGLVEGYFESEPLGEKALRGVSRPIAVHRVLRPTGAVGRLELAAGRRLTPLIGREQELARLAAAWGTAAGGQGGLAHVIGEAGIGKSRLVRALTELVESDAAAVAVWQCSPHRQASPLNPVVRFLRRRLGLDGKAPPADPLALLGRLAREGGLDPDRVVPRLADLLSIGDAGRRGVATGDGAREARSITLRVLEELVCGVTRERPLLLVVEDLHWADPTTLELLQRITAGLSGRRLLCVLTFRPEFAPPWASEGPVLELAVGPLSSENVRAMAAAVSETAIVPEVIEWVDAAADGVPLFVEEMLKMLELAGGVDRLRAPSEPTAVPATLDGLLTERLDRLPELTGVIDAAAVLGREFDRGLLEALAPVPAAELEPALAQLAAQGVLGPVEGSSTRCEFSHALLQEAAYGRLVRRRRQGLHRRAAEALRRLSPDVAEREPELLAHHWECAGEGREALRCWRAAGRRALERASFLEAAEHFRRALHALDGLGGGDAERIELLTHLGPALQAGAGYTADGVDEAYAQARAACRRSGRDDGLAAVIRGEWLASLLRARYGTARELADEMLALSERGGDPALLAEGHMYRGFTHMYRGEFDEARRHLTAAYERHHRAVRPRPTFEAQGDTAVAALAYLALVLWNLGHLAESRERSDLSLELAERDRGAVTRAQAYSMRSILHLTQGEPEALAHWVDRALTHSANHNIGYWQSTCAVLSAWLRGRTERPETGITLLEESLDHYLRSGSRLGLAHFCIYLADLRLASGDRARALAVLRTAEEHVEATGERFAESELCRFRGRALMTGPAPDPVGATAAYTAAVAAARSQNARLLELRAATRLARHQQTLGEAPTALERVAELYAWFPETARSPDVARARALLAEDAARR